jgi:hypothetical protein
MRPIRRVNDVNEHPRAYSLCRDTEVVQVNSNTSRELSILSYVLAVLRFI